MCQLNFYDTIFILQNDRWPDGPSINNYYINVIDPTKKRYRIENSEQTKNT